MTNFFDIVDDVIPSPDLLTVEELKREYGWPFDYTSTLGIAPYIRRMGNDVTGIEIGTGRGEGSYHLLETCHGIKKIYTIDAYREYVDWNGIVSQSGLDTQKDLAQKNFDRWGDRVEAIHISSSEAASRFANESQHFLYIDGDHSANSVYADLMNYYPKVRKNGIVAGSSYGIGSVKTGLDGWRSETKNRYPLMMSSNNVWLFYKR